MVYGLALVFFGARSMRGSRRGIPEPCVALGELAMTCRGMHVRGGRLSFLPRRG